MHRRRRLSNDVDESQHDEQLLTLLRATRWHELDRCLVFVRQSRATSTTRVAAVGTERWLSQISLPVWDDGDGWLCLTLASHIVVVCICLIVFFVLVLF